MDSTRGQRGVWPAAAVLFLSLLLHAAVLLLPLPGPGLQSAPQTASPLIVDLIAPPSTAEPEPPSEMPESTEPAQDEAPLDARNTQAVEVPETVARKSESPSAAAASPSEGITRESDSSTTGIRTQVLRTARELGRQSERADEGAGLRYRESPPLPSRPGWLDQYTGPVTASLDRWRGRDGSRNARIVTGSGQVICVRTRAPTTAELFNPWMSAAVPMMRDCGRERPAAPDRDDPWLRAPREAASPD